MYNKQRLADCARRACAITLVSMGALLLLPQSVVSQPTATTQEVSLIIIVPCANGGAGEIVTISGTLHLLIPPDASEALHGNWSNARGIGLTTGDVYVLAGSPSNLVPAADGEFLTNITLVATGPNGVKFTITRIGPLFQPPTEVLQAHCS